MRVYIETNFVLELVLQQEYHDSCEEIIQICEQGFAELIIPAYSLAQPHERLTRQARSRKELQRKLNAEIDQLLRTASYKTRIKSLQDIDSLIIQSNEEERERYDFYRQRIINVASIVDLSKQVIQNAAGIELSLGLSPQDALVYASILDHLRNNQPQVCCFLNRNNKDFDDPDIQDELSLNNCRLIFRFDHGLKYILSQIQQK